MAGDEAFLAIRNVFDTSWSATPVFFENEEWSLQASPASFLFVEVFSDFFNQESMGGGTRDDNLWREQGQLLVHVMSVKGTGSQAARQLARQVIDLFRGLDVGVLTFFGASIGAGAPGTADGNYWRLSVTLDWSRDE